MPKILTTKVEEAVVGGRSVKQLVVLIDRSPRTGFTAETGEQVAATVLERIAQNQDDSWDEIVIRTVGYRP